ncbi:MAG: hypothetical protein HDR43_02880 [Mycoplasma sp.]|nr:hypothetical protein [Mycoplasma sp.]
MFAFDFSFISKDVKEIIFDINNTNTKVIKPSFKYVNSNYTQTIYSPELLQESLDFNKIKTIQITLKNNECTRVIGIVLNPYKKYKQDYFITNKKDLFLNFQNSIIINGEKIKNTFSSIKFSPCKIQQGIWNQNIMNIEHNGDEMFNTNVIKLISLDKLPITSSSKSSFLAYIDTNKKNSTIKIEQNTYYDLNKKETIKGFGLNSNPGYLPPFEFSGLFFPVINLNINNLQFEISWEQNFDKPYFKEEQGINKINLELSYTENKNLNWITISMELINESNKYNFTFNEFKDWLIMKGKN